MFHKARKLLFPPSPVLQKDELPCYLKSVLQWNSLAKWLNPNLQQFILHSNITDFIQAYYMQQYLSVEYLSGWVFLLYPIPKWPFSHARITLTSINMNKISKLMCFNLIFFFLNHWWLQITNTQDEQKANTCWNQVFWCSSAKAQNAGSSVLWAQRCQDSAFFS